MKIIEKMYEIIKKNLLGIGQLVKFKIFALKNNFKKNDKARILIIAHDFAKAGAQVLLKNIVKELNRKDYEVTIISKGGGPLLNEYEKFANVFICYNNRLLKKYIVRLKNMKCKMVLTNTVVVGDTISILKENNYYVVSLIHELPLLIKENKFESRAREIGQYSDVIIFPSNYVKNKFEQITVLKGKVVIKPQGLYLNNKHIANKKNRKKEICQKYGISEDKKIIINVATGIKRKGFDWFIEIASMLNYRNDIAFIWVGDYDKSLLNSTLKELDLNNIRNLYFAGYIDNSEELSMYYDSAELLMLTSREEPFGSIVLEAFNSKTPVLAFKDGGGYVDLVKEGVTGFLVEYGNIGGMAQKLIDILDNTKELEIVGEKCKSVVKKYNFEQYVATIEKLLLKEEN